MSSQEEIEDVKMEVDSSEGALPHHDHQQPEDALDQNQQPEDPLGLEEDLMDDLYHQPVDPLDLEEDFIDDQKPAEPLDPKEDSMDHHLEDVLDHQVKDELEVIDDQPGKSLHEDPVDYLHQAGNSLDNRLQMENENDHLVKDEIDMFDTVFDELEESLREDFMEQQAAGSIDQNLNDYFKHHSLPEVSVDDHCQFKDELDHDFETEDTPLQLQEKPAHQQRLEDPPVPPSHIQREEEYFNYLQFEKDIENYTLAKNKILVKKTQNVQTKIFIANSTLKACKKECKEKKRRSKPAIITLQNYTNQSPQYLNLVIKGDKFDRSLKEAIMDTRPLPKNVLSFIYSDIRDIFIDYYVEKKQLPTIIDFLKNFQAKQDNPFYKQAKLRTLVKNNLVNYHHIPKLNRYILSENPELAYKRNLYLRQIISHRSMGTQIIYVTITKTIIDKRKMFLAVAASSSGLIDKLYTTISLEDDKIGNKSIKSWIQSELIPKLASTSVIVLTQPRKAETVPNEFSIKEEMINWLQKRGIPFDADSHSAQLYNLIKLYKKKIKESGLYDEIFTSSGFKVIICPIDYHNLDFFKTIHLNGTGYIIVASLKKLSQGEWSQMEMMIAEQEKQMMREDDEMGRVVDNLFCLVKTTPLKSGIVKEEFPDACRGTKAENFSIHIGDIIVD